MPPAIEISGLTKIYQVKERRGLWRSRKREIVALDRVALTVRRGELFGLLGPNGAGKTTLIKCLTTLLIPTAGTVRVNGFVVGQEDDRVRASIGCLLNGERELYWKLTGRENLAYFGALYYLPPAQIERRIAELTELLGLEPLLDRPVETFSSGQKMKLAFAKALVNRAPLLVLDEPANALDVPSARELRRIIKNIHAEGRTTILYTSHQMAEVEELCRRVAIVDRGQVIAEGTVDGLKAGLDRSRVIKIEGAIPAGALAAARELAGVVEIGVAESDGLTRLSVVTAQPRRTLPPLIQTLLNHNASLEYVAPATVTLEDVFLAKTGRTLAEDTAQG
ncbi:MAG: ABC transporter ATP-binding protein [Anaerolineae bacterium]